MIILDLLIMYLVVKFIYFSIDNVYWIGMKLFKYYDIL